MPKRISIKGLGRRIRIKREERGWEVSDFAEKLREAAGTKTSPLNIAIWESEVSAPSACSCVAMAAVLGVSVQWLLTGE